jgi:ribonuclease G
MYTEIIINVGLSETRIAVLEDRRLVELWVERSAAERIVGDVYKGRVESIIPGLQAAFLDIGQEKSAFLHVSDFAEGAFDLDDLLASKGEEPEEERGRTVSGSIEDYLKVGQELLVQVSKEPIGTKGPRVTTKISLAGRTLVLIPNDDRIGISKRLEAAQERDRLRKLTQELRPQDCGLIVRTAAEGRHKRDLQGDLRMLERSWARIRRVGERAKAPALVHRDIGLVAGMVRDIFTEDIDSLVIDDPGSFKEIIAYLRNVSPALRARVKLFEGGVPIFEAFEVEDQIVKALDRKVWLKKGAYLTIDQTEALVTIDVNTGRFVGQRDPEETALQTNLLAAGEIARQLRLRDIGGIIVIDFIDMERPANKRKVLAEVKAALKKDRSRSKVLRVSPLGLVEMTRKRVRPSLLHTFCEPCPYCEGTGRMVSRLTVTMQIERWLQRGREYLRDKRLVLRVHPRMREYLAGEGRDSIAALEKELRIELKVDADPWFQPGEFRFFDPETKEEIAGDFPFLEE